MTLMLLLHATVLLICIAGAYDGLPNQLSIAGRAQLWVVHRAWRAGPAAIRWLLENLSWSR